MYSNFCQCIATIYILTRLMKWKKWYTIHSQFENTGWNQTCLYQSTAGAGVLIAFQAVFTEKPPEGERVRLIESSRDTLGLK